MRENILFPKSATKTKGGVFIQRVRESTAPDGTSPCPVKTLGPGNVVPGPNQRMLALFRAEGFSRHQAGRPQSGEDAEDRAHTNGEEDRCHHGAYGQSGGNANSLANDVGGET